MKGLIIIATVTYITLITIYFIIFSINKIKLEIDLCEGELLSCFLFVAKFQNFLSGFFV